MNSVGGISAPHSLRPSLVRKPPTVEEAGSRSDALTEEEKQIVAQMKARDREVRDHEQAHKVVGGRYAGAISYDFNQGPDGKQYAVGGEVAIDTAPVPDDLRATVIKMEVVIAAALAPAEPSAQDRAVALLARSQLFAAQSEMVREELDTSYGSVVLNSVSAISPDQESGFISIVV